MDLGFMYGRDIISSFRQFWENRKKMEKFILQKV